MTSRFKKLILLYQPYFNSLALLIFMLAVRMIITGTLHFGFLVWNIFLALLPLLFARLLLCAPASPFRWLWAGLWLIFFPNAAYLLTDIVHLSFRNGPLFWLDLVLLFGSGLFGVAVGLRSLRYMEAWWGRMLRPCAAQLLTLTVLGGSGYGIYLGRVERWNSWDVVFDTGALLHSIAYELRHPFRCAEVWMLSGIFAAALLLAYTASGRRLRW